MFRINDSFNKLNWNSKLNLLSFWLNTKNHNITNKLIYTSCSITKRILSRRRVCWKISKNCDKVWVNNSCFEFTQVTFASPNVLMEERIRSRIAVLTWARDSAFRFKSTQVFCLRDLHSNARVYFEIVGWVNQSRLSGAFEFTAECSLKIDSFMINKIQD